MWVAEVGESISTINDPKQISLKPDCINCSKQHQNLTKVHMTLTTECQKWTKEKTQIKMSQLIKGHTTLEDIIYVDGSIKMRTRSIWGFSVYHLEKTIKLKARVYTNTAQACI